MDVALLLFSWACAVVGWLLSGGGVSGGADDVENSISFIIRRNRRLLVHCLAT